MSLREIIVDAGQAIESGKLDTKDTDKAKGNCPVDVTFFWESVKDKLPRIKSFKFDCIDAQSI